MATVYFPAVFFKKVNCMSMEVGSDKLIHCLEQVCNKYPEISDYIFSDSHLTSFVKIFINQVDSNSLSGLDTNIGSDDEIQILLAVAGG